MSQSVIQLSGDLLTHDAQYIVHQCNCISHGAAGLAAALFSKYPYADIYKKRATCKKTAISVPGTIGIEGNGDSERFVINLFGQYYPGGCSTKARGKIREGFFLKGLRHIYQIPKIESIAFPYMIGCGLAGGNWDNYLGMIDTYAKHVSYPVYIVKLEMT